MACLIIYKNDNPLLRHPITKEKLSIGRDPSCDIVLPDDDISRLHCEIYKRNGKLAVKDTSKNGTFINKEKIAEKEICERDKIGIGSWTIKIDQAEIDKDKITVSRNNDATKIISYDTVKRVLVTEIVELIIKSPDGQKITKRLKNGRINIGTDPGNTIVIEDDYISKRHCKLSIENDDLFLIDLGSTNGTFYEGEKIDKILLPKNARFAIGKSEITVRRLKEDEKLSPSSDTHMGNMIGASDSMKEVFTLIKRVASTEATVCITGESGTGKELVARSIYEESGRNRGPFVAINCGAIPPNIIESELFGHEKGAFTGASVTHRGVFEQAHTGTLFLDEIGEMPPDLQTRLLRVLETKVIRRIGGHRDIPVDVRIIAATNQDLKQNVADGRFREDLFFRLYIIPIHLAPLRERRQDIEALAKHFAKIFSTDGNPITISPKAIDKMMNHNWCGNARELKNTIQRAMIMCKSGTLNAADITLTDLRDGKDFLSMPLISQEKEAICEALRRCRGNQSKAAHFLGIARTTLANKIRKYEIDLGIIKM